MSLLDRIRGGSPIAVGQRAPALSLTADEGTWVRSQDFQGHIHVVLVFFRTLNSDDTDTWLRGFQALRADFERVEAALFGVTTYRTDKLREYRASLGLDFYLLYDPLAFDSRRYGCAGRIRPYCKNSVVVIGKDGTIAHAVRGTPDPREVLRIVARLEGVDLDPDQAAKDAEKHAFSTVRNPGQRPDEVKILTPEATLEKMQADEAFRMVDVRTRSEYDADHVPGSIHIPVDEIPHRYQELGQTTHLIFMCQAGGRAAAAAEFITSIGGSEIYVTEGGMTAWSGPRVTGGEQQG